MFSWGVVFDMDGVIIDSEPLHASVNAQVFAELGIAISEREFHEFVGWSSRDMWSILRIRYHLPHSIEHLMSIAERTLWQTLGERPFPDPIAGAVELIKALKKDGVRLAVASSSPGRLIDRMVRLLGIDDDVTARVGGDEVMSSKPDPAIYLRAALLLDLPPSSCVAIEDSQAGVLSASAAGIPCVGLRTTNSGRQDLVAAALIVDRLDALSVDLLRSLLDY